MADQNDLMRKIQGLLAKAEHTDNENEAEAFFSKARELMVRYSIDEMVVRGKMAERGQSEQPILEDYQFSGSDSNAVGKSSLLNQVCIAFGVRMVLYSNRRYANMHRTGNSGIASQWCAMVGFKSDIEAVKMMYLSLTIQDARFARAAFKESRMRTGESKFKTGHLVGFAIRVGQRLMEQQRVTVAETSTSALVVVKDQDVKAKLNECFPHLKTGRSRNVDWEGRMAGQASGSRADIGNARVGAGSLSLGSGR